MCVRSMHAVVQELEEHVASTGHAALCSTAGSAATAAELLSLRLLQLLLSKLIKSNEVCV